MLLKKIEYLKLDNITLYKGSFKDSLSSGTDYGKAMCCLIDCDLYESYKYSLPLAWKSTVENGMLYLDEYYSLKFPGARIATDEYFQDKEIKIHEKITDFDPDFKRCYILKNYKSNE